MIDFLPDSLEDLAGTASRLEEKVDRLLSAVERVEKLLNHYKPLVDLLRKIPFLKV